ncbi:HAD-IA family hydrolase [Pedobacter sp. LMG 31464]|uniref:HAD-IA family hydrolase n=1 Tax=Pedobacter planticolens TaxID=2679964 RepID=A0A923DWJ9_9SPHI|nr:HAD family phosphatase [Pedobacter planticolens]MBB2145277.1 HAD-IA family hydrolase [Pedobacter planticolens]
MEKIKNIIFDYGNVIFEINFKRTQAALLQLGIANVEEFFAHKKHNPIFDNFETAAITPAEFRAEIRAAANNTNLTDAQIDEAWNSLLIGVSGNNHEVLLDVKKKYRTFLLSNNNEIHYDWIINYIKKEFGIANYDNHFEKAYFSQHMRLRKPNVNIFEQVIKENNLNPQETLFIDDSPQHIEGAKKAGLHTLLMDVHPEKLNDFLHQHHIL